MRVELDVFSGRENPRWILSADATREFIALLASLSPEQEETGEPPHGGLGYRGFILTDLADVAPSYDEIHVLPNRAIVTQRDGPIRLFDPDRRLERWLLESGSPHIGADLVAEILADIVSD